MPPRRLLRVAVPAPVRTLFDYLPPAEGPEPAAGTRLRVPFGRGERCGVLVDAHDGEAGAGMDLKRVAAVLDAEPLLGAADLSLLQWAARYYQHPPGEVVAAALPLRLRQGKAPLAGGRELWRLTAAGRLPSSRPPRAPRQERLIAMLAAAPDGLATADLAAGGASPLQPLRALAARGWVERVVVPAPVAPTPPAEPGPTLNAAQADAVASVTAALGQFAAFLVDGVTGSGKTEVYLALVRAAVARRGQVLVLVPEIGLTPQMLERFRRHAGARIVVLHSGLSEGDGERAWLAARDGSADVLIGTRSAVFAALPRLALVIVDEEHDPSYKQQEGFRYSARDVAVVRAREAGCPVVLGSATPSLESLRNAQLGRYRTLRLPQRAGTATAPRIDLVDIRAAPLAGGLGPVSQRLARETVARGEQVLLFLNRRGYAPVVMCHACGWVAECRRCDARMTFHGADSALWCHHCGAQRPRPPSCPACGTADLRDLGQGTERLEEAVARLFPGHPAVRIDRDSTRRRGALERSIEGIRSGRFPLLVGTQMLAKGHHFPNVTLVVVIDADQGLYGTDFRASERMAQLIEQVAGRAGRADKPGRVLIQTRHPDHPLLQLLVRDGYAAFARAALAEREAARLPPFVHQVLWRAEAARPEPPAVFLEALADLVRRQSGPSLEVWGPVPAPMERRAGRYRAHLLVQSADRPALQAGLAHWVEAAIALPEARRVRWSVDVDPAELH
ncbi:MAG: primosomal protein N' [Gammaproteobacteria bacterium]|nr:primosomal protein N' [Gammaproteobacteria bacterium]